MAVLGSGLLAVMAVACVAVSAHKEMEAPVPEFVFTYAENQPEDYPTTQGAYRFAQLVYERTEGRIEIQVNAGGVLWGRSRVRLPR